MQKLPENRLNRRMPRLKQQIKRMDENPTHGLNFGGIRGKGARRGAGFGRKKQGEAPDATS